MNADSIKREFLLFLKTIWRGLFLRIVFYLIMCYGVIRAEVSDYKIIDIFIKFTFVCILTYAIWFQEYIYERVKK